MRIKEVIVHPILNGNKTIDDDVKFEINFSDGYILKHHHIANNNNDTIYTTDFDLNKDVRGKLWAFDRLTESCYFTLYPSVWPMEDSERLEITIRLCGPSITWSLWLR